MSSKRRIVDVETKCRLCLGDEGCMSYLFDEEVFRKVENITKCTFVVIKEDRALPNKICHVCMYKLDMWTEFQELFLRSNEILLTHLEPAQGTESTPEVINSKRKHVDVEASGIEILSDSGSMKKRKPDEGTLQPLEFASVGCVTDHSLLKDMYIPEDDPITSVSKNNHQPDKNLVLNASDNDLNAECKSNITQPQIKPTLIPMRVTYFNSRRGRTTARRRASTKRWVERKRALLAATGKCTSDTDSIISDNESKLSPVQKARAKTNADKEVEKQKKLARALKNLETDMKGEYGTKYDNDAILVPKIDLQGTKHQTRSQKKVTIDTGSTKDDKKLRNSGSKDNITETKKKGETVNQNEDNCIVNESVSKGQPTKLQSLSGTSDVVTQEESYENFGVSDAIFNPQPITTEICVGNATYIITSTLVLSEPHELTKTNVKNGSKDKDTSNVDENSQDRNTDIIDAVQLRRINPKSLSEGDEKRNVERCLNIEVEGTELESLQRVQAELTAFVERDIKAKLSNQDTLPEFDELKGKPQDPFKTLEQQLKAIVEKAIRKNIETSRLKKGTVAKVPQFRNQKVSTFSPAFVKAAMRSKIFQPKVLLMRLDLNQIRKQYKINNISLIDDQKSEAENNEELNASNDTHSTTALERGATDLMRINSDTFATLEDQLVTSTPKVRESVPKLIPQTLKTNEELTKGMVHSKKRKELSLSEQVLHAIRKGLAEDLGVRRVEKSICETVECDTTTKSLPVKPAIGKVAPKRVKFCKTSEDQVVNMKALNKAKFHCRSCKQIFGSLHEEEEHEKTHKPTLSTDGVAELKKPRMMRCKRCHEIVDAKLVKVHTCRSAKSHKCYVCNANFRSQKLLISHLETHDESEFNIENIERGRVSKKTSVARTQKAIPQPTANLYNTSNQHLVEEKPIVKETYICFVCDKKFVDQEILKDHLQQHCNDVSEDEASSGKDEYQCAICGDTLETEEALENHLEKHLCDDEDDNPNLISISNDSDTENYKEIFKCSQCTKEFDSEMLLAMHVQAHEEEIAIAEWQKQSTEEINSEEEFMCAICEETFKTEDDIMQHLVVHNDDAHVCFLCEQPFLSLEDLQMHVATH